MAEGCVHGHVGYCTACHEQAYVQALEKKLDEAQARIIGLETKFLGAGPTNSGFELRLAPPKEMVFQMIQGLTELVKEANYVEIDAGEFTVNIQRRTRPTPHEKRKEAEKKIDSIREETIEWVAKQLEAQIDGSDVGDELVNLHLFQSAMFVRTLA